MESRPPDSVRWPTDAGGHGISGSGRRGAAAAAASSGNVGGADDEAAGIELTNLREVATAWTALHTPFNGAKGSYDMMKEGEKSSGSHLTCGRRIQLQTPCSSYARTTRRSW